MRNKKYRRKSYILFPHKDAKFKQRKFNKLTDLKKYLFKQGFDALGAEISITKRDYSSSCFGGVHMYCWADRNGKLKLVNTNGRGSKRKKFDKVSKSVKKYYTFFDKFMKIMCKPDEEVATDRNLLKLLVCMKRMGFVSQEINSDDDMFDYYTNVMDSYTIDELAIENFGYWSDRCGYFRKQIIVDMIVRDRPHIVEQFNEVVNSKRRFRL